MRVLLADDQANVRSALQLLLEQALGLHEVCEATNVSGLLSQVETNCPDLVLLDWELPDRKGLELVPSMKTICPELVVIALSSRPEARQAALSAGADAFVSKADTPERLLAAITECWHRRHTQLKNERKSVLQATARQRIGGDRGGYEQRDTN